MGEKISTYKAGRNRAAKRAVTRLTATVIFIILIAMMVTACGGTGQGSQNTGKDENKAFGIGEVAEIKDIKVTLLSVTESAGSTYNKPTEGNVFVLCEFEIANDSSSDLSVSSMMSFEGYCDDYACSYSIGALLEKGDKNQLDGTVAAGKKLKGVIGYEVPVDWKEMEIHFTPDLLSQKELVFIATNS